MLLSPGFLIIFSVEPETLSLQMDRDKYEEFLELYLHKDLDRREL